MQLVSRPFPGAMVPCVEPAAFVFGSGISGESVSPLFDYLVTRRNDALLPESAPVHNDVERKYVTTISNGPDAKSIASELETGTHAIQHGGRGAVWIDTHPWSGKTRVMLPRLVREARACRKRCVILVPNRTVAREVHGVLGDDTEVRFDVTDLPTTGSRRAVVMCHSTYVQWLMRFPNRSDNRYDVYIMDEAHVESAEGAFLQAHIHAHTSLGSTSGILLSTTHPERQIENMESNYPIQDQGFPIKKEPGWQKKLVSYHLECHEGNGLVVVATHRECDDFKRAVGVSELVIISLHGGNHAQNMGRIQRMEEAGVKFLVIATEIIEVGFNCDLECVYDLGEVVRPMEESERLWKHEKMIP